MFLVVPLPLQLWSPFLGNALLALGPMVNFLCCVNTWLCLLLPPQVRERLGLICHYHHCRQRPGQPEVEWTCPSPLSHPLLPPLPPFPNAPLPPLPLHPPPPRRMHSPTATLLSLPVMPGLTEGPPPSLHNSRHSSRFPRNPPRGGHHPPRQTRQPSVGNVERTPSWIWSPWATREATWSAPSQSPETTSTLPRESLWSLAAASNEGVPLLQLLQVQSQRLFIHHPWFCPTVMCLSLSLCYTRMASFQPHNLHNHCIFASCFLHCECL